MVSSLVIFPIFILIEHLFRRTKIRIPKLKRLEKLIKEIRLGDSLEQGHIKIKKINKFGCYFPWCVKVLLYSLSLICIGISIAYATIKGFYKLFRLKLFLVIKK